MTASTSKHEPALDGIRGLAVAGVLLFHGGYLNGGYLGVDAFFVLSGFLITTLLLREQSATGGISLVHFWVRRARRLLPAIAAVMLVVAAYAAYVAESTELNAIRWDAFFTLTYLANWRQVFAEVDYFALYGGTTGLAVPNSPLNHTWSLAIEEQFYVLWPIFVLLATRGAARVRPSQRVLAMSLGLAAISVLAAQLLFEPGSTNRVYYGTDTRIAAILFGAAFAAWRVDHRPTEHRTKRLTIEVLAFATIAALAVAWTRLDGTSTVLYRGGLIACGLGVVLIINAATHPQRGLVYRMLAFAPLRALGTISYGLYLWHVVVYVVVDERRTGIDGIALLAFRLAITGAVAWASYQFIERPIRYGAGTKREWRVAIPVLSTAVAVAVIASTLGATSIYSSAQSTSGSGGVLVVGDSVAHSLYPGLARLDLRINERWNPGCRLIDGTLVAKTSNTGRCDWQKAWQSALKRLKPSVVVLVLGGWDLFDVRVAGSKDPLIPGTQPWAHEFEASFEAAIRLLSSEGAHVIVPNLPCFGTPTNTSKFKLRSMMEFGRVQAANTIIADVVARYPTTTSPNLRDLLCPSGKFQMNLGQIKSARPDGVHFGPAGANYVARWLQPLIDRHAPKHLLYNSAPIEPMQIAIIGDTPLYESQRFVAEPLDSNPHLAPHYFVRPLAALCDFVPDLKELVRSKTIKMVIIATTGPSATPCMRDAAGTAIEAGSKLYFDRYRADVKELIALVPNSDIVFAAAPPARSTTARAHMQKLESILRSATKRNAVDQTTNTALGGPEWTKTMPCTEAEAAAAYCRNGMIEVRGPNSKTLCPNPYTTLSELARGCRVYSGGAHRYADGIVRVIISALETRAQFVPPEDP